VPRSSEQIVEANPLRLVHDEHAFFEPPVFWFNKPCFLIQSELAISEPSKANWSALHPETAGLWRMCG
jgi:hypothetical protein